MEFIHTDIDKTVLPKTKGKKVGDYRFYDMRVLERIYLNKKNKCLNS